MLPLTQTGAVVTLIVTWPADGVVTNAPVTMRPAAPAVLTFTVAAPLKFKEPIDSGEVEPPPLVTIAAGVLATVTLLIMPVPSTEPCVSVTLGLTATPLFCSNLAVGPLTVMPLEELIWPKPDSVKAPPLTEVCPL